MFGMKICIQILGNIFYSSSQIADAKSLFTVTSAKRTAPILHEIYQLVLLSYSSFYALHSNVQCILYNQALPLLTAT